MTRKIPTLTIAATALTAGMALMPMTAAAEKPFKMVTIDCDAGQSIQSAVDQVNAKTPLTLIVSGECEENVLIRKGDVTIDGNKGGAVSGKVEVSEGGRATIQNLCISMDCPNSVSLTQ